MKTKNSSFGKAFLSKKRFAMVQIAIVLCSLFIVAIPAIAAQEQNQAMQKVSTSAITTASEDDYVLGVYGNANEDDTIDMGDVVYTKLAIFGKKPKTELCDAKYDGRINVLDVIQTKLIILGKEKEITIADSADRIVTVKKPIERVVPLSGSLETLRSIKATEKIVGVSVTDDIFFPEFCDYPNVGGGWTPDIEKILELQPDVVFLYATFSVSKSEETQNTLESADPTLRVIRFDLFKPESYAEEVRKLGYLFGKQDEAKDLVDFYQWCMNTIDEHVKGLSEAEKPKVYAEWFLGPYRAVAGSSGFQQKIAAAGGSNIFGDLPTSSPTVDPEEVIERNPDVIVKSVYRASGYDFDAGDTTKLRETREEIMNRPELVNVAAVKTGRIYIIDKPLTDGPRYFVAIAYLAKWFHPEFFEDLDPKALHQEYLTRFQGLDYDLDKHGVFVYHPEEHPDGH